MKTYRNLILLTLISVLALILVACGGDNGASSDSAPAAPAETAVPAGDAIVGKELFDKTCLACHGEGGVGIAGLGKDMTTSEFIKGLSDAELLAFIKVGRSTSDPANTTGVDMAPRGGNPSLNDGNLIDIIAYIRTLEK